MKPRLLSLFFIVACAALLAQNYSPTGLIPNQGTVGTDSQGRIIAGTGCAPLSSPTANLLLMDNGLGCPAKGTSSATIPALTFLGNVATDSASLGSELTTSGTCSGTGWTGTYPNYVAPGTTAPLTCTGFTSGQFYQTVTSIGAGGSGAVTIAIGTAQLASGSSGTVVAGLKANGTSLTFTPAATYTGTIGISAKSISPITLFSETGKDSTGAVSTQFLRDTLASAHNDFGNNSGAYCTTCSNNANSGYEGQYSLTTGSYNANSGFEGQYNLTTGSGNTSSGYYAGRYIANGSTPNQTSSNSLYDGYETYAKADGDTNENVVGNGVIGAGSNTTVLGNASITDTYFGGAGAASIAHAAEYVATTTALGATTSTISLLGNTTASTSGATVQVSPADEKDGHAWNTSGTPADNFVRSRTYLQPVSGATPTGTWHWQASVDTGTASWSDAMTLTSAGTLAIAALNNTGASFTFNGHTCTIVSTVVTCP